MVVNVDHLEGTSKRVLGHGGHRVLTQSVPCTARFSAGAHQKTVLWEKAAQVWGGTCAFLPVVWVLWLMKCQKKEGSSLFWLGRSDDRVHCRKPRPRGRVQGGQKDLGLRLVRRPASRWEPQSLKVKNVPCSCLRIPFWKTKMYKIFLFFYFLKEQTRIFKVLFLYFWVANRSSTLLTCQFLHYCYI